MRGRLGAVALATVSLLCACAPPLAAQPVSPAPAPPTGERGLLPRYRFYLDAERLLTDDPRFDWDADFGGDLDLVDYGRGRIAAVASFETILGHQLRTFDPNQGNYTLDVSASARWRALEVALVLHHISRHLTDRSKKIPIDWNMLGVRGTREFARGPARVQIEARALFTVKRSFVDYASEIGGRGSLRRDVTPRVALVASVEAYGLLVEKAVGQRAHQNGGSAEGGLRVRGAKGAVEFFIAFERRVDADPLERLPRSWTCVGFRLLSAN